MFCGVTFSFEYSSHHCSGYTPLSAACYIHLKTQSKENTHAGLLNIISQQLDRNTELAQAVDVMMA